MHLSMLLVSISNAYTVEMFFPNRFFVRFWLFRRFQFFTIALPDLRGARIRRFEFL
jgi:hypothetical protein